MVVIVSNKLCLGAYELTKHANPFQNQQIVVTTTIIITTASTIVIAIAEFSRPIQ